MTSPDPATTTDTSTDPNPQRLTSHAGEHAADPFGRMSVTGRG